MTTHLWLPFTQMAEFDARERTFVAGTGVRLIDARGNAVFDAISSVWVTIHGHGHPAIVEAIARQAERLDHATALGATNPVAETLAARLATLTGLPYAFFASDGASALEAALKMALQYWRNAGEPQRTRFAHLTASYHGDTTGAMSVSDIDAFKRAFAPITFDAVRADDLTAALARDDLAAVVVEPCVQAAAGMRVIDDAWYAPLRSPRAPLLVVDEIATGFGRTGTLFAFQRLGLTPDLLCLGKGITGGALALSATLATARIYDAFLGPTAAGRHFFHGHSYAANPIACAAAIASLDLFDRERTLENVALLERALEDALAPLRVHPRVRDVRRVGLMCGIELDAGEAADASVALARRATQRLYERGHFTRPIGPTVQLVPPLSSREGDIRDFAGALAEVLD